MGLIARHVQSAILPAFEYRLMPLDRGFVEPVEFLYAWGRDIPDVLDQLRIRSAAR